MLVYSRAGRNTLVGMTALAPLSGLLLLATFLISVLARQATGLQYQWLPELGLNLSLHLDGLSFLFSLLILGVGLLVVIYARYYLGQSEALPRFFASLLLFMGAMLGLVLAGNLLLMLMFWELTSLASFLLIGYWRHRNDARTGARMALAVTGGGGLALLAGIILIGRVVGSYELTDVLAAGELIKAHSLYPVILVLVLLGAFTKSAQFPFHFWLPHAMAAPTPVSAYLHSATMVKDGVILLARLYTALSGTEWWFYLVTFAGWPPCWWAPSPHYFNMTLRVCWRIRRSVIWGSSPCCSDLVRTWHQLLPFSTLLTTLLLRRRCLWPRELLTMKPAPVICGVLMGYGNICRILTCWRWSRLRPWLEFRCLMVF